MKYKVVYFTRTNNSRRVAEKIAEKLSCEIIEVTDGINWKGPWGYIKGGFYSSANRDVSIKLSKELGDYDELIVVSPLWAGKIPPATRILLNGLVNNKVHLVITSLGSGLKNRQGYKSVSDITRNDKNEEDVIRSLIDKLQAKNDFN